jgi:hypothetical protein
MEYNRENSTSLPIGFGLVTGSGNKEIQLTNDADAERFMQKDIA